MKGVSFVNFPENNNLYQEENSNAEPGPGKKNFN